MSRWVVVLAGGVGSRFWPLSTPEKPKQLLPLATDEPLLSDQLRRVAAIAPRERILILTNAALVDAIAKMSGGVPRTNIIAEPKPAGTAAALAWAALEIGRRDSDEATMISIHADWAIADDRGFAKALETAATAAETNRTLVTVGIVPTRDDPGFGYIEPAGSGEGVRDVKRFVEKPTRERAAAMRRDGFLWNSGIFAWRVGDFIAEVRQHASEIRPALEKHRDSLAAFFAAIPRPAPIDTAVLERSSRVQVIAGDFGWDDVGTWDALHRVRRHDASGNATSGDVHSLDARNNVVHADGHRVVLYDVEDLVVVARHGLTLVTTRAAASDLKRLVESLPPAMQAEK